MVHRKYYTEGTYERLWDENEMLASHLHGRHGERIYIPSESLDNEMGSI